MKRKTISKITAVVSLVLCLSFLIGGNAFAYDTENTQNTVGGFSFAAETIFEVLDSFTDFGKTETDGIGSSSQISTPFLIVLVHETPELFGKVKTVLFVGTNVKIKSFSGNYCLIEKNGETVGYVHKFWLSGGKDGKLSLNKVYEHVYVDGTNYNASTGKPRTQAVYDGSGTVYYSSSDEKIISVDPETGLITGKKPGKATLIASVGAERVECEVYCIYKWKKFWTGSANKATTIYAGTSFDTQIVSSLPKSTEFYVRGDDGDSVGWAYGYATVNGTNYYGFVQIGDISTKGTISQYNRMGWRWPIKNTLYNYIRSPYGKRTTEPTKHKGFDISTNWGEEQASIEGETIVSAFKGTVDYVCINSSLSWGYCVSVISDEEIFDPVSKKQFVAIYMHMKSKPKVSRGKEISKETELGYVGNTGNSTGAHLHFEVNNQTASIYELNGKEASYEGRSSYNDLINPIFFYMTFNPKYNEKSEAEKKFYGTFWYGSE